MELAGVVVQVFMVWWDWQLKQRLEENALKIYDANVVTKATAVGARYSGDGLVTDEAGEDEAPSIRLSIDYPSNHANRKVPMFRCEHVDHRNGGRKDAAIQTLRERNDIEGRKTCEVCGIYHVNKLMMKMQYSGYGQSAKSNKDHQGERIRPINRPKEWKRAERERGGGETQMVQCTRAESSILFYSYRQHQMANWRRCTRRKYQGVESESGWWKRLERCWNVSYKPQTRSNGCYSEGVNIRMYEIKCIGGCDRKNIICILYKGEIYLNINSFWFLMFSF